jgi:hypothetical protein
MEIAIIFLVLLISSAVAYYAVKAKQTNLPHDTILMEEPKDYSFETSIPSESDHESQVEPESFTFTQPNQLEVENTTEKWIDPTQLKPISPVIEEPVKSIKLKREKKQDSPKKMKSDPKKGKKEAKEKKEVKKTNSKKGKKPGRPGKDKLLLS